MQILNTTSWRRLGAGALLAMSLLGGAAQAAHADGTTPAGVWQIIDDKSGEPKALITITEKDGEFVGALTRSLGRHDALDRVCSACTDWRKGHKLQGLQIIRGLHKEGDEYTGGKILDPDSGTEYGCKVRVVDGGKKLEVRGYLGVTLLGRTQTWVREE
ncbi:hypothetical protein PPN31114_00097 [Pandoraea pneumonica]|uniref:DUF2147 domain-containing protein n=1 Tax=Pandoraea pneumonica TaxID=2508299 RepID=A0A5E4RCN6_9BURK|nr:DUF2147 domain-containing protein [Pandoraea pneumonica]VVD60997.1 hypothetical protein PPN31114_00097 [Pandoraea pneumonica]